MHKLFYGVYLVTMKDKLTKEEQKFVENTMHQIDYERGMYQPLTDEEMDGLSPSMRRAIRREQDRIRAMEHDE